MPDSPAKVVADAIHGDIHLSEEECRVVDTASFQRLRHIKQLGMAHLVYPNAVHARFAHSLGALGTIERLLAAERCRLPLDVTL